MKKELSADKHLWISDPGSRISDSKFVKSVFICVHLWIIIFAFAATAVSQDFVPLWEKGKMPNSKSLELKDDIRNERIYQVGTPGSSETWTTLCEMWLVEMGIMAQVKK